MPSNALGGPPSASRRSPSVTPGRMALARYASLRVAVAQSTVFGAVGFCAAQKKTSFGVASSLIGSSLIGELVMFVRAIMISLTGSSFTGVSFTGSSLIGVSFTGVSLIGSSFTGVSLTGSSFTGTSFTGISLTGTSLTGISLIGVSLTGVSFTGAPCSAADITVWSTAGE